MADFVFDASAFRTQFPAFTNQTQFSNVMLQSYWNAGSSFISTTNYGAINGANRNLMLNLMTAHMTQLSVDAADGTTGLVKSATIDKVSVTIVTPPETKSQLGYWLNKTPYGQELYALMQVWATGGLFVGGSPVRASFRNGRPW